MYLRETRFYCPNCNKKIIVKQQAKTLIRCSKCLHFVLIVRGESHREIYDYITPEENVFFSFRYMTYKNLYEILIGVFYFDEKHLEILKERSKRAGVALEKYLKSGKKKNLTPLEKNILYKLKTEDIFEIEKKIEKEIKYLRAKIECTKLLKILDY